MPKGRFSSVCPVEEFISVQVICPSVEYEAALISTGLVSLDVRRANLSAKVFNKAKETLPLRDVIPLVAQVSHGYTLRSGSARDAKVNARTNRFRSFITMRYV